MTVTAFPSYVTATVNICVFQGGCDNHVSKLRVFSGEGFVVEETV